MRFYFGSSVSDANLISKDFNSFEDFCRQCLKSAEQGSKDGTYFVVGDEIVDDYRSLPNIKHSSICVLDGDKSIMSEESCIDPKKVHDILVKKNITHCIYTSFSHDRAKKKSKFRLVWHQKSA